MIDPIMTLTVIHTIHTIFILTYPLSNLNTRLFDQVYLVYMTFLTVHWVAINGCILSILKHKLAHQDYKTIESNRSRTELLWRMTAVVCMFLAYIIVWMRVPNWHVKYVLIIVMMACTFHTLEKRCYQYRAS